MFKEGHFYREERTGNHMAIVAEARELYYPYNEARPNLIAQFSNSDIVVVSSAPPLKGDGGEIWVEITREQWNTHLKALSKSNTKEVAARYLKGMLVK